MLWCYEEMPPAGFSLSPLHPPLPTQTLNLSQQVKARGARVYVITDNPKLAQGIDSDPIIIPNNGPLTALIAVLPLQLIAYELALLRGINPDTPRNLAKAVTTD